MNKLVEIALKYYGTNPENWTFPWCAAFLNKVLDEAGINHGDSLMARWYLNLGMQTTTPELGDIVILWRVSKDSQWGHVGLYINEDEQNFYLLGGNQDGTTNIKAYQKFRLLDIRRIHDEKCA